MPSTSPNPEAKVRLVTVNGQAVADKSYFTAGMVNPPNGSNVDSNHGKSSCAWADQYEDES